MDEPHACFRECVLYVCNAVVEQIDRDFLQCLRGFTTETARLLWFYLPIFASSLEFSSATW